MKHELFEVTFDVTPVIFASEESAGRAAASMSRGMVAKLCNGKLTYAPVEPQVRRVVIDIPQPRYKKMIPAFHAELEAAKGDAIETPSPKRVAEIDDHWQERKAKKGGAE